MEIKTLIPELILRHECLVIPGLGGFVSRTISAQIDWKNGVIHAPNKELIFNTFLQKSDGILVAAIASEYSCSYQEATDRVSRLVAGWNQIIQEGGRVDIEKVGCLYREANGAVRFEQDRFFNLLLASFGMGELSFMRPQEAKLPQVTHPAKFETEEIEPAVVQPMVVAPKTVRLHVERANPKTKESLPLQRKKKMPWRIAAAAVILPIGFFAYWLPMHTPVLESGKIALSDFNPFRTAENSRYTERAIHIDPVHVVSNDFNEQTQHLSSSVSVFNYAFNETLYIPIRIQSNSEGIVPSAVVAAKTEASFHLIGGCFSSSQHTEDFIQSCKEKGLNAFVLDTKGGLSRVSVAQSNELDNIRLIKSDLTAKGVETWLLRK